MALLAQCPCGQSYELKDEYAGQLLQCPKCGNQFQAPTAGSSPPGDPSFARDKFLLRQKHLSISEKYFVWDEQGNTILYIVRPAHLIRNLAAALVAAVAALFIGIGGIVMAVSVANATNDGAGAILAMVSIVAAVLGAMLVGSALSQKRHIAFYRDETARELLLEVKQDQKLVLFKATFTLCDPAGQALGRFEKNYLYNIFRKRWRFFGPEGDLRYVAKEDSIILSMLRRLLGPLFGLLRTNYIILDTHEHCVGTFNRKLTLLDRYVLDLTQDPGRSLDRRVAVALGVLLDTGERR